MEKQIFERFMELRFPKISKTESYYNEWKIRFKNNPIPFMDFESSRIFKYVLNELYIDDINNYLAKLYS